MNSIDQYISKISSTLAGGSRVKISTFITEHTRVKPVLHPQVASSTPDISALVYTLLRLPPELMRTQKVILGQSDAVFRRAGYEVQTEAWRLVQSPARKRKTRYNASNKVLAAYVTSISDVEDIITNITALYIEVQKLHTLLVNDQKDLQSCLSEENYQKLTEALNGSSNDFISLVLQPIDIEVQLLAGSLVDYSHEVQSWWLHISESTATRVDLRSQPVYFVSSNSHSLKNILSGFDLQHRQLIEESNQALLQNYATEIRNQVEHKDNLLYYLADLALQEQPEYQKKKRAFEDERGLSSISFGGRLPIKAQVFSIADLSSRWSADPRLQVSAEDLDNLAQKSNALIVNIAYPLGMAAYNVLKEVSENVTQMLGLYVMGKAASLNAQVADITIPNFAYDLHSRNSCFIRNVLSSSSFSPYFKQRSIFDKQRALTVRGTFLQNETLMEEVLNQGYSIIEMEAGPYLNRVYEMSNPKRYPENASLVIDPGFRLGFAYYVSDTPYQKGVNLGSKRLRFNGLDATYAISLGILQDIFTTEVNRVRTDSTAIS